MIAEEAVRKLAAQLDEALLGRAEVEPLTKTFGALSLDDAYAVQRRGLSLRLARGERVVGFKMGLTSEAKRSQMNLGQPICGPLTDAMRVPDASDISITSGIHPKAEPEIAFVTSRELRGRVTRAEALQGCRSVAPAIEVLDSRFVGFKYFSLPDVVADNCSSWRFVLGQAQPASRFSLEDLAALQLSLSVSGKQVQTAPATAISGHPIESLVQLVAMLDEAGEVLPAGSIVLAGAATAAEPLALGQVIELDVPRLGRASLRVTS